MNTNGWNLKNHWKTIDTNGLNVKKTFKNHRLQCFFLAKTITIPSWSKFYHRSGLNQMQGAKYKVKGAICKVSAKEQVDNVQGAPV